MDRVHPLGLGPIRMWQAVRLGPERGLPVLPLMELDPAILLEVEAKVRMMPVVTARIH